MYVNNMLHMAANNFFFICYICGYFNMHIACAHLKLTINNTWEI